MTDNSDNEEIFKLLSTKETGNILEKQIEHILKSAGFRTSRNVRLAKYEIDVLGELGDLKIVFECKNYQNSHLVIRNLIHQWHSKNDIIKVNKIVLVLYGVTIKNSDKELASKFNIKLWGEKEINKLLSLLIKPDKLRSELLKDISLRPASIGETYRGALEKLIFYPLLQNESMDEEEVGKTVFMSLKTYIRTELQLNETSADERKKHIQVFENEEENYEKAQSYGDFKDEWSELKERLEKTKIFSKEIKGKYLKYVSDLRKEFNDIKEWFSDGSTEKIVRRVLTARIYDSLFDEGDDCEFGFDSSETVQVKALGENKFVIQVAETNEKRIEILNWLLTSENYIQREVKTTNDIEKIEDTPAWTFSSIEEAVEAVCRILYEFYNYDLDDKENKIRDYTLNQSTKKCFIATAAYGTPFANEINILRYWRDTSLLQNLFGRIFVKTYYKISPHIANYISKRNWLKTSVRYILNPFVKLLKRIYKVK